MSITQQGKVKLKKNNQAPVLLSAVLDRASEKLAESDVYFGHGTDNAWDEAVQLVCHVLNIPPDTDRSVLSMVVSDADCNAIDAMLNERISMRKPLPYLTQQAWFMGMCFYVDERVLIPRSPFAEIIAAHFTPWINPSDIRNVLEIGTGSGCMAIAAASVLPSISVTACDISEDALAVATINVERHGLQDRVSLVQSNVFENVKGKFDVIMSNPPYVDDDEMASLPAEYRLEPDSALRAADSGLCIVHQILLGASRHLTEHGILIVEVGNTQEAMMQAYPSLPMTWIDFEWGGHGVFLLTKSELEEFNRNHDG